MCEKLHFDLLLWDFFLGDELVDSLTHGDQTLELSSDFLASRLNDLLLALGAGHEAECDLQSAPLTLQELENTLRMENMSTPKLHTSGSLELASVTNAALIGGNNVAGTAARLDARHAMGLAPHPMALVTAGVKFIAPLDLVVIFVLRIALRRLNDVNPNSWDVLDFFRICVLNEVIRGFALLRVSPSESQLGSRQLLTLEVVIFFVLHISGVCNFMGKISTF